MNRLSRAASLTVAVLAMAGAAGCSNAPAASGAVLAAAPAHVATPVLRQVTVKATTRYGLLWTVRTVVVRSDHQSPKGLRICVQQRTGRRVVDLACGPLNSHGAYLAKLYQANSATTRHSQRFQLRAYHPAGGGFGAWAGAWVWTNG